jgi:hypothetical protein
MEMPTPFGPQEEAALKKLVRSKGQRRSAKGGNVVRHFLTKNPYDFLIGIS